TPKSSHHPELRKYARATVAFDVVYGRDAQNAGSVGLAIDLGGGGLRLASEEDLPLGTVLLLRFRLPSIDRETVARGRIVLSYYNAIEGRYFHGIAFTQIGAADQTEIMRFVAEQARRAQAR
ncbi:MAG: PilZ domain-containing protein, partial [Vulcanimicrobiaceae bacterium]